MVIGPGTFPCHNTGCNLCTNVGRNAKVYLGRHGQLQLNKRETRFPNVDHQRFEVKRVIAAGIDLDEVLRDWFSHVTQRGIHPGHERISAVDIIPHEFRRKNRERKLVEDHMFWNDDFDYLGNGRGCFNTYSNH